MQILFRFCCYVLTTAMFCVCGKVVAPQGSDALTADHPAVVQVAEACGVDATISAELCAQLRTLHKHGALPFDLNFSILKVTAHGDETVSCFDLDIQAADGGKYLIYWFERLPDGHAYIADIYTENEEERLFYAGKFTAQKYHLTGLDETTFRAENTEKLETICGLDPWAALSVWNQLNVLEDELSTADSFFSYVPFDTVTLLEQTPQGSLIRIVSWFTDVPDAVFFIDTSGIVPVIEPIEPANNP